jgi:hypothetical protein
MGALRSAILRSTIRYRYERPPSDDMQHLPFILSAEAGVTPNGRTTANIVIDKTAVSTFMAAFLLGA